MNFFEDILLGIIQGLTEFLPVSSSGHIIIGSKLLGLSGDENLSFTIVVHVATVLSTIVVLWNEIWKLLSSFLKFQWNEETRYVLKLFFSMIPVLIVGLFFESYVEQLFGSGLIIVGVCLLLTALLLTFAYSYKAKAKEKSSIGWKDTFVIGLAQAVAVLPGLSRSGATIATGILLGNKKEKVAEFSFLMVLIPVLGEALLKTKDYFTAATGAVMPAPTLIAGFLAAFITGYIACRWMISIVKKGKLIYFAIYCALVGMVSLVLAAW
jgi:undecaprenyl-diphosphatase